MAAPSAQATLTLQDAFERFASTVTPEDRRLFHNTQLKDVREEAIRIERQLRARRMQKNMARLDPFLRGMEHYSKVVEVLCNGTPYLAWIWAPVKLMLTIAVDSISAFEKLIEAYGKIADMLPRLDRLSHALSDDHNFQNVLALVYSDIVEFHRRAYKFVRRKSWAIFFGSMWAGFESRFNGILKNLAYHGGLVDKEAAAAEISEAVRRSKADDEKWEQQEREWNAAKIQKVLAWLGTNETLQADILERYMEDYLPGSCEWFVQHKETQLWLGDSAKNSLLWLCGKPGAGKSVICSSVVQHAEANAVHIFYCFCSFLGSHSDGPNRLLRSIISQVLQKHQDLAIYVHDVYFTSHPMPTKKALLSLLPELLQGLGSVRLVIDGVDEWSSRDQKELLKDLAELVSPVHSTHNCKIMIASRETMEISRSLRKKEKSVTKVSLSNANESFAVTRAIANFIDSKLSDLPDHFDELDPDASILAHVKETLRKKSHGMFLWVNLVLKSLDTVYSPEELRTIVDDLPSDLENLYDQIFTRLCSAPGARNYGGVPGVMSWICFAQRPLHKSELLHGLSIFPYNSSSQVQSIPVASILDHCKPLIEELPDSTIVPVHFSVKEYFLKAQTPQIVPAIKAALDISSACAIIITRSLNLLRFKSNSLEYLTQVASGNYRLLPYAIEFWIEHCSQYASGRDSLGMEQQLEDRLTQMHEIHENCWHALGRTVNRVETRDKANDSHLDERLRLFSGMKIYQLMADLLNLRILASKLDGDESSDIETYLINNDQTLFSQLSQKYENAIVHLLAQHEVEGISSALLRAFQESYASNAFFCRFPHCDRLSLGFPAAQLRCEHEVVHIQRVYCQTASCQYSRIGFAKKSALKAHTRKHHGQSSIQLMPAKVRSSKPTLANSEETSTMTPSSPFLAVKLVPEQSPKPPQRQQSVEPQSSSQSRRYDDGSRLGFNYDLKDADTPPQRLDMQTVREDYEYQLRLLENQNKKRKIVVDETAKKLMEHCRKEVRQKFEDDVLNWPEAEKKQLLGQGIDPIFRRFQLHASMLCDSNGLDEMTERLNASVSIEFPQDLTGEDEVALDNYLLSRLNPYIDGGEFSPHQVGLETPVVTFKPVQQGESQGFHAPQEAE